MVNLELRGVNSGLIAGVVVVLLIVAVLMALLGKKIYEEKVRIV